MFRALVLFGSSMRSDSIQVEGVLRLVPVLLWLATVAAPSPVHAECGTVSDRSNLQLIAALPADVESALVLRIEELEGEDSLLRPWVDYLENPDEGSDLDFEGEPDLSATIEDAVAKAGLHTLVWGGSSFVAPEGIGASRADFRKIFVAREDLGPLHEALRSASAQNPRLERGEVEGTEHFHTKISTRSGYDGIEVESDYFVSFLDPCTLVTAQTLADLEGMVAALKSGEGRSKFEAVVQEVDSSSPILLARDLLPPLLDGKDERLAKSEPMSMALALPDPTKPRFEIALRTEDPLSDALRYFREVAVSYAMSESDYELHLAPGANGFRGELVIQPHPREPYHLDLITFWFFGIWMTI